MKNLTKGLGKNLTKKMIKLDEIEVLNMKQAHNLQGGSGHGGSGETKGRNNGDG